MKFTIVRDPLWNNIKLDATARRLVDTAAFQRLRYVRQLGLAHLIYPGATHSRFEHALGAYHLAGVALELLRESGELNGLDAAEPGITRAAALLHDIGHYPFSHALEEIGIIHHEDVAKAILERGEIADVLMEHFGIGAPIQIWDLVRGSSKGALQGLISGSLDLDKIEYLKRDALMCGVPYGQIDVDRLLHSLVLVDDPRGQRSIGVAEKGLSALESLLFAKYQMYRNVYWHHAVRSATAMYKRIVADALRSGTLTAETLTSLTDEGLIHKLGGEAPSPILEGLRRRRLYKRAFELPAAELDADEPEWIADDPELVRRAEDRLAVELGLASGEVLLDYPAKTQMLGVDICVLTRGGAVERLAHDALHGVINLPSLADRLYKSARWLRVFTASRITLPVEPVLQLLHLPREAVVQRLDSGVLLELSSR
jgi:HD superfamily phosphohydrolase